VDITQKRKLKLINSNFTRLPMLIGAAHSCFFEVGDYNNNTTVLRFAARVCKTVERNVKGHPFCNMPETKLLGHKAWLGTITASCHGRPDAEHPARLAIARSTSILIGGC
jgi:hypothetical protein